MKHSNSKLYYSYTLIEYKVISSDIPSPYWKDSQYAV